MGSKDRIAKYIIPIITKYLTPDKWYVEPFCGGCNMISKINHPLRMANDSNKYLISLLRAFVYGDIKLHSCISKDEYDSVKLNKEDYEDWYVGFVGFLCSFRGKFFNGWINPKCVTKEGTVRNFQQENINNLERDKDNLSSVVFLNESYCDLSIPSGSIVYCDPPYEETTSYKTDMFDHNKFWDWCRDKTHEGNDVFISEYRAPSDFVCVWEKQINMSLSGEKGKKATEKLFVHKSIADKYITKTLFDNE